MANSRVLYPGNSVTTQWVIPFPFLSRAHVTATVNGVSQPFTWINDGLIEITPAVPSGSTLRIRRDSSPTTRLVDYQTGPVGEDELDTDSLQAFYLSQEAVDEAADSINLDFADSKWDADGKVIKDVGQPTAGTDAANKDYVDAVVLAQAPGSPIGITLGGTNANNAADARTNLGAAADAEVVKITGNQTVAGIKTFSSLPVLPAGTPSGAQATRADEVPGLVPAASTTVQGKVELATTAETQAGSDAARAVTPAGLKAAIGFSNTFLSATQTITSGGLLTLPHGLGAAPLFVTAILTCTDAGGDAGYAQNDQIIIPPGASNGDGDGTAGVGGYSVRIDATNIYVRFSSSATVFLRVVNGSTGNSAALTNTRWNIRFRAFA